MQRNAYGLSLKVVVGILFGVLVNQACAAPRLAVINSTGSIVAKEGSIYAGWTTLPTLPSGRSPVKVVFTEARVAALDSTGMFYESEGPLGSSWTLISGNIADISISGQRMAMVSTTGDCYVQEGSIYSSFTLITGGVAKVNLSGNRIGVLKTDGSVYTKEESISGPFVLQVASGASAMQLTPGRTAYLTASGGYLYVREADPNGAGYILMAGGITQFDLTYNRIAALFADGTILGKEGGLSSAWITVAASGSGASRIRLANKKIAYLTGTSFYAKDGALDSSAVLETGNATDTMLSEYAPRVAVAGGESNVYTYASQMCNVNDMPDTAARAFRDTPNSVLLIAGSSAGNWAEKGASIGTASRVSCSPTFGSLLNPLPEQHADNEWINALYSYTAPGNIPSLIALVHNEYHGWEHPNVSCNPPKDISGNPILSYCLKDSVSLATSANNGGSFAHSNTTTPQVDSIATLANAYSDAVITLGLHDPSNIVKNDQDGYYYATLWSGNANQHQAGYTDQPPGMCMIRTNNLADPKSWRAYSGGTWTKAFWSGSTLTGNTCDAIAFDLIPQGMMPTQLGYSTYFQKFLLAGYTVTPSSAKKGGVWFMLSDDLIHWGSAQPVTGLTWPQSCTSPGARAYAALLDDNDSSTNFERPGQTPYLLFTQFLELSSGTCQSGTNNRNLIRVPLKFDY